MADGNILNIGFDKGLITGFGGIGAPPGSLFHARGWYYRLGDPNRLWKVPGRELVGTFSLEEGASITGMDYIQNRDESSDLVVLAGERLYVSELTDPLSFTKAVDGNSEDYVASGPHLRMIFDGRESWWAITGDEDERPLVRDKDGTWRRAGMAPSAQIDSVAASSTISSVFRPQSWGVDKDYHSKVEYLDRAADSGEGWDETAAKMRLKPKYASYYAHATAHWDFNQNTPVDDTYRLYIDMKVDDWKVVNKYDDMPHDGTRFTYVAIYVSVDGGQTYELYYETQLSGEAHVCLEVPGLTQMDDLSVKIDAKAGRGVTPTSLYRTLYVYDIRYSNGAVDTSGDPVAIPPGTYYYVMTEVYRKVFDNGSVMEIESMPAEPRSVTIPDTDEVYYQVTLELPEIQNTAESGYVESQVFKRIYRSTSTGGWPDLGLIAELPHDAASYVDDFTSVGATDLGTPTIPTAEVNGVYVSAAQPPPALYDACYHRGAIVGIGSSDRRRIYWSMVGYPEYWPATFQSLEILPTEKQDTLQGIVSMGNILLIFTRDQVFRLRGLPFVNSPGFGMSSVEFTRLASSVGLAGSPNSIVVTQSNTGYIIAFWVASNGIWMTDGGMPSEGGLGVVKASVGLDWQGMVDTSRLEESVLAFDEKNQVVRFLYHDIDGDRRELWMHLAPEHWIAITEGLHKVPKVTGPHPMSSPDGYAVDYAVGAPSGDLRVWCIDSSGRIFRELSGAEDEAGFSGRGNTIVSVAETGWLYPQGPFMYAEFGRAACYHNDWGHQQLELEILGRIDADGTFQHLVSGGISLAGERATLVETVRSGGGQSFKFILTHRGSAPGGCIGGLSLLTQNGGYRGG